MAAGLVVPQVMAETEHQKRRTKMRAGGRRSGRGRDSGGGMRRAGLGGGWNV